MKFGLALALLCSTAALAQDVPLRPITYNLDPKLSEGAVANFLELYVDPDTFVREVVPAKPPEAAPVPAPSAEGATEGQPAPMATAVISPPTGTLLVLNDRGSWADVTVGGTKVGKIGPHVWGVIGPVRSGTYAVSLTYANGYVFQDEVKTTNGPAPGAFGGPPSTLPKPDGSHTTKLRTK